jgi:hypothetical protein
MLIYEDKIIDKIKLYFMDNDEFGSLLRTIGI